MYAVLVGVFAGFNALFLLPAVASAASPVVISQVQPGDTFSATNEAVEIYNNTTVDQDITNWCLRYAAATSTTFATSPKFCFVPVDTQTKMFLSAGSYASIVTAGYVMPSGMSPDGRLAGSGIAASGGHIKLLDHNGQNLDTLGWGSAQYSEGFVASTNPAPAAPSAAQALHRKVLTATTLKDTDDNRADFELRPPAMRGGGIYEIRTAVDVCGNLAEIQEAVPLGYGYDEAGNCELLSQDKCSNIPLIQTTVPENLLTDTDGSCQVDVCRNLENLQRDVPPGYSADGGQCALLESRAVLFSEILPNVSGSDSGYEFIELFNPQDVPVDLKGYQLQVGKNLETTIVLGLDQTTVIPARGYLVFSDTDLGFTLLNTTGRLRLVAPAGNIVSEVSYLDPKEDESYALFSDGWRYTNRPTPRMANLPAAVLLDQDQPNATVLITCPAGKYRHPITNRCRNIEGDTTMLVACGSDEYRNPETNRCRKVAALTAFSPCSEGSERNPETNRCRKVAGSTSTLAPCQPGYERNPTTNRCRKSITSPTTTVSAVPPSAATGGTMLKNSLVMTAGLSAVGYGLYEWRSELLRVVRRLVAVVSGK